MPKHAWVGLGVGFILSLLFLAGLFSNIQLKLADSLYGGKQPLDKIVIVAIDDKSLQELGRWPWPRSYFADLLHALNQSRVIGMDVAFFEASDQDAQLAKAVKEVGNVVLPVEYLSFSSEQDKIVGRNVLLPVGELKGAAKDLGYINIVTDKDGVTRSLNLGVGGSYKNFAAILYELFWKKPWEQKDNRFLVNSIGKPGSFQYYPISNIVKGRVHPEVFKDKLVLVGATSPDLHDDYFVPTSQGKAMPGVEIHANALQTMITKRFLKPTPSWLTILVIFVLSFLTTWLARRSHMVLAACISFFLAVLGVLVAIPLFEWGLVWNLVYPPLTVVCSFVPMLAYHYVFERREKKKAVSAFGKYLSPVLVHEIMRHPEKLKLGGECRNITVFFSDVRGFTSISEKLSPEELVKLLNEYLSAMTQIILENKGLVDKYIGDAIMAFWGAPLDEEQHASLACWTALEMRDALDELREKWIKSGYPRIDIGVGVNSGDAVVGNMGSMERFDYTAMGDTVNLASRLEGLTKQYGVMILVSESTQKQVKEDFVARKLDLVAVKGKKEGVSIYELVGKKGEVDKKTLQLLDHFEDGLKHYEKRQWSEAIKEFERALKIRHDKPSELFIERCKSFQKTPPPKDWDGIWVMTTK